MNDLFYYIIIFMKNLYEKNALMVSMLKFNVPLARIFIAPSQQSIFVEIRDHKNDFS